MNTVLYSARRIHTMDPARPSATHVAVRDGRIVGVGTLDELAALGPHDLDERFADAVLLPGFVEGHTHSDTGNVWQLCYCGSFDRIGPDGRRWRGLARATDVLDRLRSADRPGERLVFGWGFDPLFVDRGFTRDLYVSLGEPLDGGAWSVRVYYKPLVGWIWGGCLLMALGGLLAIGDRRYRVIRRESLLANPVEVRV